MLPHTHVIRDFCSVVFVRICVYLFVRMCVCSSVLCKQSYFVQIEIQPNRKRFLEMVPNLFHMGHFVFCKFENVL